MIIIGSRGSRLALWQARHIAARLGELGAESRIEVIKTTGDKITGTPLAQAGGKGLFTKEIEEALLAGTIDVAVHSLKDMPTGLPAGLTLAAFPEREEPRDALVGRTLAELREGSRVGTSSLRRAAQLRALGRGIVTELLRGNVDTRLRKFDQGQCDAIVLAAAGLRRLGWQDRITELLPVEVMCPAAGQGALAIETRETDRKVAELVRRLDHNETRTAVTAERALLATLGGGCQVPIGAHAHVEGIRLRLRGVVATPDGVHIVSGEHTGIEPETVGRELGRRLLAQGAREILAA